MNFWKIWWQSGLKIWTKTNQRPIIGRTTCVHQYLCFIGQIWSYTGGQILTFCSAAEKVPGGRSGFGCKFLGTPKLNITLYDCIKSKDQLGWSKVILGHRLGLSDNAKSGWCGYILAQGIIKNYYPAKAPGKVKFVHIPQFKLFFLSIATGPTLSSMVW